MIEPFQRLIERRQLIAHRYDGFWASDGHVQGQARGSTTLYRQRARALGGLEERRVSRKPSRLTCARLAWKGPTVAAWPSSRSAPTATTSRSAAGGRFCRSSRPTRTAAIQWVVLARTEGGARGGVAERGRVSRRRCRASTWRSRASATRFFPYVGAEIKEYFEELKGEIEPDVIFTHYRHDLHQDHRLTVGADRGTRSAITSSSSTRSPSTTAISASRTSSSRSPRPCSRKASLLLEHFPSQPDRHVVHCRGVPRVAAATWCRGGLPDAVRGGVPRPEAGAGMTAATAADVVRADDRADPRGVRSGVPAPCRPEAPDHRRRRISRLLPRPGRAALERATRGRRIASEVTVFDNYIAGRPGVARRTSATRGCASCATTSASRCRTAWPGSRLHRPRGRDRVADLLPPPSHRDDGRERHRAADAARACDRAGRARRPVEGFLFFSSSEIYGDPSPEAIPTPETYRGNVSCTGPRACYDESKRYGETLCVNFAQHHGVPVTMARPFNNYGPGLKITRPPRDSRLRARHARRTRTSSLFSDGMPTRTFCYAADAVSGYYKVLVARAARGAVQHRRRGPGDLDARAGRAHGDDRRESCSATRDASSRATSADADYLVGQPEPPLPDDREGAHRARVRPEGHARRRARAGRCSGTATTRAVEAVTRLAIVGAGYVGLVTGACLAETGIEVVCVDLIRERVAAINDGARADVRGGPGWMRC